MGRRGFARRGGVWLVTAALTWGLGSAHELSAQAAATSNTRVTEGLHALIVGAVAPEARPDGRLEYRVGRTDSPIRVDGRMEADEWATAVIIPLPFEVSPADNGPAPVATECRLAHDADNLYLGCAAVDPDPAAIRAYVVDRDGIGGHDRIVLTLDPFNDQRRGFQFGISALGVQSDAVLAQGGGDPNQGPNGLPIDPSWDAIWSSAGTVTDSGYVVEAAIPFRSLRFPRSAGDGGWGAYLTRWLPRSSNVEVRSARWDRADSCLLCQANVVTGIGGGAPGANIQLTPTLTGSRTESRASEPGSPLSAQPADSDFGLDAQWGPTSDLMLNLTLNPDFSQVEADVAQLDVNNRFALFFPEKRTFFLEGGDFFGTPVRAVFTRSIADPTAGAKITGKLGANAVGLLVARDRTNNVLVPGSHFSTQAMLAGSATTAVARFRRDVGGSSTLGALYAGREGDRYHNRVGGFDLFLRPTPSVTVQAQLLGSQSEYPDAVVDEFSQPSGAFTGSAIQVNGGWTSNAWVLNADARRIDDGFRADAGFVTQAGVKGGSVTATRRWWGGSDHWYSQLRLEGGAWRNDDFDGNPVNGGLWFGLTYQGPGQTFVGVWPNVFMTEHYAGTTYRDINQLFFNLGAAPAGSWSLGLDGNVGDAIDFANGRLGSEVRLSPNASFRVGRNVEGRVQHTYHRLDSQGRTAFTAHLSQVRAVYNFSTRSFVRAIVQLRRTDRDPDVYTGAVDRRSEAVLAQLLYSYKLNPQTVLFLGFSQDGAGQTDVDRLRTPLTTRGRTFFLKLGYAWRP